MVDKRVSILVRMDESLREEIRSASQIANMNMNDFMCSAAQAYIDAVTPSPGVTPHTILNGVRAAYTAHVSASSAAVPLAGSWSGPNPFKEAIDKLAGKADDAD